MTKQSTGSPNETRGRGFKIGQSLIYRRNRMTIEGRYLVLEVLRDHDEVCYRIRSQDDGSLEYTARESEL